MSKEVLQPLLDGLKAAIEAYDNNDPRAAGRIRNDVYPDFTSALSAKKLTKAEEDEFERQNELVWAAESDAWSRAFGDSEEPAKDPESAEVSEADSRDVEPEGANWEQEVQQDPK